MQTQYTVIGYKINLCFYKYNLATEVDELGHNDRYLWNTKTTNIRKRT